MPGLNPENERAKRAFYRYLREALGRHKKTIDKVAAAVDAFEAFTGRKDFKTFRSEQAENFKHDLLSRKNKRTCQPLSYSTILHRVQDLRAFFRWLSTRQGYRSLSAEDAEYFNLPARETRIAYAKNEKPVPTIEQIVHVLQCAPSATAVDLRNRALVALTLLTGVRDGATASLKIKHVDVVARRVLQPAREVNTKAAKTIDTWFFPAPVEALRIVEEWLIYLKENHFGPEDPLFPSTRTGLVNGKFAAVGLSRSNWATTTPIREIFKAAFQRACLPYCNPHSFRTTLALLGEKICRNAEELKAWSQNLGHDGVLTTLTSYGNIGSARQGQIMNEFTRRQTEEPPVMIDVAVLRDVIEMVMQKHGCRSSEAEEIANLLT